MAQVIKESVKRKIYEKWIPKLEKRFGEKGIKVSESRMKEIAVMAHTRKVFESTSTLANTPGRGAFAYGNDPSVMGDSAYGSAEIFQSLFGVFVDVAATTFGMELLPLIPMTKSNITMVVAEPVYAGGKKDSTSDKIQVFQVKGVKVGIGTALSAGSTYVIKTAAENGEDVLKVQFIGNHQYNGNLIFKLVEVGANHADETISEALDFVTNTSAIYTDATNYIKFDEKTVDYVNGFTNFVGGFTGAGLDDQDPWKVGRNDGKSLYSPMSRETGEGTAYRTYGARMWSKTFSAETFQAEIAFTTEQIQDAKMDHDFDMMEFGDSVLTDALSQSLNNHILSFVFAAGWDNHKHMNDINGFNINTYLNASTEVGSAQSFVGLDNVVKTIAGTSGVLPGTGAIAENLSTLQKRIITRMFYASTIIKNRGRSGKGNTSALNGTYATAIRDIKGFALAPFTNSISDDASLTYLGEFYGINVYEDSLQDLDDGRICVFNKGNEKNSGLKLCPYILGEKLTAVPQETYSKKTAIKSRYALPMCGSHGEAQYLTFVVESGDDGYSVV